MKPRLSNIELLRIISMFFVLVLHCNTLALELPRKNELIENPDSSIFRLVLESFTIVAANVFVLISGWFGIHFKWKGLFNLLFQCAFFFFGIYAVYICINGLNTLTLKGLLKCLMISENAWFVKSYLGLYIIAPALNAFINTVNRSQFKATLILFYIFQFIYGWLSQGAQYINYGLSAWSFIGLYLLARYVKIYMPSYSRLSPKYDMLIYLCISMLISIITVAACYLDIRLVIGLTLEYTSPFVIISSLYLLLFFSKINIQNKTINWIAKSCFAVFLMQFIIWDNLIKPTVLNIDMQFMGIIEVLLILIVITTFYTAAVLLDKIRLLIWNKFFIKLYSESPFADMDKSV